MKNQILCVALCLSLPGLAGAQTKEQLLARLLEDERSGIEALALYSGAIRLDILELSRHPELLVKMEALQHDSRDSFSDLLRPYPEEVRQEVWDLTRYPGLVADLAAVAPGDPGLALEKYPEEIWPRARSVCQRHPDLLAAADGLSDNWNLALSSILQEYPPSTGEAVRRLLGMPEVLDIMAENIGMTVLVGDLYQRQPAWLLGQMDSLAVEVSARRAAELEDWREGLEANPAARAELAEAAAEFASTYVYDDAYYDYDDLYYQEEIPEERFVTHHYYFHYPYWFGYPGWFLYPRWRPCPWWWDWGFYWNAAGVAIVSDLPSWYFLNWYFFTPRHHWRYPQLSAHFVNHYYGHRHHGSSIGNTVHRWQQYNREVVTEAWLEQARFDANAFRQFGKFEEERERYNGAHRLHPLSQQEYLGRKAGKYPALRPEAASPPPPEAERPGAGRRQPLPPAAEPGTAKQPREAASDKREQAPPAVRPTRPTIPKAEKAREYHRDNWSRAKPPQRQPEAVRPARPGAGKQPQVAPKPRPSKPGAAGKGKPRG